ncbi:MAG: hypothetical protein J5855_08355 [Mailhella sp.]|nr:hypothetical protein [Mailhella sp.]
MAIFGQENAGEMDLIARDAANRASAPARAAIESSAGAMKPGAYFGTNYGGILDEWLRKAEEEERGKRK